MIEAVERAFASRGFATTTKCNTLQCGIDLHVSNSSGREWRVEAKGFTSSDPGSSRYGKPFTASQVSVHVARAIHQSMCLRAMYPNCGVAVALPDESYHRKEITAVGDALDLLGIRVFWVSETGKVELPSQL